MFNTFSCKQCMEEIKSFENTFVHHLKTKPLSNELSKVFQNSLRSMIPEITCPACNKKSFNVPKVSQFWKPPDILVLRIDRDISPQKIRTETNQNVQKYPLSFPLFSFDLAPFTTDKSTGELFTSFSWCLSFFSKKMAGSMIFMLLLNIVEHLRADITLRNSIDPRDIGNKRKKI